VEVAVSEPLEPFKFPGNKAPIVAALLAAFPPGTCPGTYREPFLGGGAVFHHLRAEGRISAATLSDLDAALIGIHRQIRDEPEVVIAGLEKRRAKVWDARYFSTVRAMANAHGRAADLIACIHGSFNGLYRRSKRDGAINTPWNTRTPGLPSAERIRACSERYQGVVLTTCPALDALAAAGPGDWSYLDSPYVGAEVFSGYGQGRHYTAEDLHQLVRAAERAADRGAVVVLSHLAAGLPPMPRWTVTPIDVASSMAAKAKARKPRAEVIAVIGAP
jgi:DNA adenine methylase